MNHILQNLFSKRKHFLLIVAAVLCLTIGIAMFSVCVATLIGLCCLIILSSLMHLHIQRYIHLSQQKTAEEVANGVLQVTAYQVLMQFINPRYPLPAVRGWAASPDLLTLIYDNIMTHRPQNIVECGSGISTLIGAYCLEKLGSGKLISLDHEQEYGGQTTENLKKHQLSSFATVLYAPLISHTIQGASWKWYDIQGLHIDKIDMLVIDGPPYNIQKHARFPALPLLLEKMSNHAVIILDDCNRREDQEVVEMWIKAYPNWQAKFHYTEKGAYVLTRKL